MVVRTSDGMNRLRWLCRRGMKELDVLLEQFLARNESELEQGAWPQLEALLCNEDDELWSWVQHPQAPSAADYQPLLMEIIHASGQPH